MYVESQIGQRIRALVEDIQAPEFPLEAIRERMSRREGSTSRTISFAAAAAAAAVAIALLVTPIQSSSFVQSIEARVAALLHWTPPPPPPKSLLRDLGASPVTLDQARKRVTFKIVPPDGVPADVRSSRVEVLPTALYSRDAKTWKRGENALQFSYRRAGGRSFAIIASTYEPSEEKPSKYIFDGDELDANGLPHRYDRFVWRNGNQEMSAVDRGITAKEILSIRDAMHGIPIATVWPPHHGSRARMMIYKKP